MSDTLAGGRFLQDFRADLHRQFVYQPGASLLRKLAICIQVEGVWAIGWYRLGRALRARGRIAKPFWPFFRVVEILLRLATGIHLDIDARIGPGFYVGHHGAITIGPGVEIGPNCSISQMCWVSAARSGLEAPRLGERVYIGPGAKIFGAVTVGSAAAIGAAAVVLEDVPAGTTVVGNPARVVSRKGSEDLIYLGEGTPLKVGPQAGAA